MRMIFVNLPVKELEASKRFFGALGFTFNPTFTTDDAACMVIEENIYAMLLTEPRFRDFIDTDVSDATKATEVLLALSAESREEVDTLMRRALDAGATECRPVQAEGPMYSGSFHDLDGHVWEVFHMDMSEVPAEEPLGTGASRT